MPPRAAPAGIASNTTAGWMLTIRPYTRGATMLPCTMLKTRVKMAITTMSWVEPTATVTRNARPVVSRLPMYGMKPPKNDRTASGQASGIPSSAMTRNWLAAPTAEIAPVPIM